MKNLEPKMFEIFKFSKRKNQRFFDFLNYKENGIRSFKLNKITAHNWLSS